MRKTIKLIILTLLLGLITACREKTSTVETKTTTTTELRITPNQVLTIIDLSPIYEIEGNSLQVYKNNYDKNISYVNIIEFIDAMQGGIVDLETIKSDNLTISFTFYVPEEYHEIYGTTYTYEMVIDADKNTISFNDFDMLESINTYGTIEYQTEIKLTKIEFEDGNPAKEINLSNYDMDIILYEDEYYIPLYLANLFFTGSYMNVYETGDKLYVFDTMTNFAELINGFNAEEKNIKDISKHTENYLALYFDYFYGLKEYRNVESYKSIIKDYQLTSQYSYNRLHNQIDKFLSDLNDLHTSMISGGHFESDYFIGKYQNDKMKNYVKAFQNNSCLLRTEEISYETYDNKSTIVISVNQFTLETKDLLKSTMRKANNYKNIIIDLSCNSGGNIIAVVELLSYLTDLEIPVYSINPATGGSVTEYYQLTGNALKYKNFYVYTSQATFSAANLFASIVKDMGLGVIIGEKSLGGASAISLTVLPDGSIISNSSNYAFVNKNGEIIEDGIDVDIPYKGQIDWYTVIDELNDKIFTLSTDIVVHQQNNDDGTITLYYNLKPRANIFYNINYNVYVCDDETYEVIEQYTFTTNEFTLTRPITNNSKMEIIIIEVNYNIDKLERTESIYKEIIDDHFNSFDTYASELLINKSTTAYSHNINDKDVFKFTVTTSGTYQIMIDGIRLFNDHHLYDENGNLLGVGHTFDLEPGEFYIVVSTHSNGTYTVEVKPH